MKYTMTCSCGHVMEKEAATRDEAVTTFKAEMTAESIATHMAEKHAGEPVMSVGDCHAMIEKMTQPTA